MKGIPRIKQWAPRRIAVVGRPGIGGEFLDICEAGYGRYLIRRFKTVSSQREARRQCKVDDLPGDTMIFDLLSAIEGIVEHSGETTDHGVDFDCHGLNGAGKSLRDRFDALAHHRQ